MAFQPLWVRLRLWFWIASHKLRARAPLMKSHFPMTLLHPKRPLPPPLRQLSVLVVPPDWWWEPPWRWSQSTKRDVCTTARLPPVGVSPSRWTVSDSPQGLGPSTLLHRTAPSSASSPDCPPGEGVPVGVTLCVCPLSHLRGCGHVPGPVPGGLHPSLPAVGECFWVPGGSWGRNRVTGWAEEAGAEGKGGGVFWGPPHPHGPLPPGLRPDCAQSLWGEHVHKRHLPPAGLPSADHPDGPRRPARYVPQRCQFWVGCVLETLMWAEHETGLHLLGLCFLGLLCPGPPHRGLGKLSKAYVLAQRKHEPRLCGLLAKSETAAEIAPKVVRVESTEGTERVAKTLVGPRPHRGRLQQGRRGGFEY